MIGIVECGIGNLRSVQKAFEYLGFKAFLTNRPEELLKASALVLPGVGAFGDFMELMGKEGLVDAVKEFIAYGRPFLGICLGMQVLFEESEEFGLHKGLGVLKGRVVRFPSSVGKIPHMGWNSVEIVKDHPVFSGIEDGSFFYFVHSYHVVPEDDGVVLTRTEYGGMRFVSSVGKDNILAFQFHPEKSQRLGLKLLENFAGMMG